MPAINSAHRDRNMSLTSLIVWGLAVLLTLCFPLASLRYVEHLSDKDGENHAASLVRLCTYSRWPALSIQRAIKKLVDRLVKSCVTVAYEGNEITPVSFFDLNRYVRDRRLRHDIVDKFQPLK